MMKVKVSLINDYKNPEEVLKSITSQTIWIDQGEKLYAEIVEIIEKEIKRINNVKKS